MKNKFTVTITSALLAVAALTSTADARCAFSNPTESSTFAAGDTMQITWFDDESEEGPKCADLNLAIELRVGTQNEQSLVATVTDGISGGEMGTTYQIPKQLSETADNYFLEMHDDANDFQNFSARFTISGIEDIGKDPTDPEDGKGKGKDEDPDTDPDADPDVGASADDEDDPTGKEGKGEEDTKNPEDSPDSADPEPQSGPAPDNNGNGGTEAGNTADTSANANNEEPEAAAASSWFVSFASLAIVTITITLSNVF